MAEIRHQRKAPPIAIRCLDVVVLALIFFLFTGLSLAFFLTR